MNNKYIGIDLGKLGGLVVLQDGKIIFKIHMPMIGDDESGEIDIIKIAKIIKKYKENAHVITEKFGGFFGYSKKAAVSLNGQKEAILALCKLLNAPYTCYMPNQWHSVIFEGQTTIFKKEKGKKTSKKDTKAMALSVVKRLFPHENLLKSKACKKPHGGIVDAICLAEFGRRKNL